MTFLVDSCVNWNLRSIPLPYYELLSIKAQVLFSCGCPKIPHKVSHAVMEREGRGRREETGETPLAFVESYFMYILHVYTALAHA